MGHHNNTTEWLKENEKFFLPPVCNKMMHNDQLKVFYVGGPNQRKDFHLEEGEELFYMRKGNMSLPILTQGQFRTIHIKEGEVFLLPGRYYVENCTEVLFERWFHCQDLGTQLKPVIEEFFASEACKTGTPEPPSEASQPAWEPDSNRQVEDPFNLQDWLDSNRRRIRSSGRLELFSSNRYQSDISVLGLGQGSREIDCHTEAFLWQLEGSATITYGDGVQIRLKRDETLLVPGCGHYTYSPSSESMTLSCVMNPQNKDRTTGVRC